MITLDKPITITRFGKVRTITEISVVNVNINTTINKVLVSIENKTEDKTSFNYGEVLELWGGVKADNASTPDPKEGSYFADRDTSDAAIQERIKFLLNKRP